MSRLVAARVRHQPAQALLVTLLAALVSLSAVLGVAYARAVEQSVAYQTLAEAPVSASGVSVSVQGAPAVPPQQLHETLAGALADPRWERPVLGASADGLLVPSAGYHLVSVAFREGLCGHVTISRGACLSGAPHIGVGDPGQALVSARTLADLHLKVGDALPIADGSGNDTAPILSPRIVGVYQPYDVAEAYWFDRPATQDAVAGTTIAGGDNVFVDWPTLSGAPWRGVTTTVDVPLALSSVGSADTDAVRRAEDPLATAVRAAGGGRRPSCRRSWARRRSSAFSFFSSRISAISSLVLPGRTPPSTSA